MLLINSKFWSERVDKKQILSMKIKFSFRVNIWQIVQKWWILIPRVDYDLQVDENLIEAKNKETRIEFTTFETNWRSVEFRTNIVVRKFYENSRTHIVCDKSWADLISRTEHRSSVRTNRVLGSLYVGFPGYFRNFFPTSFLTLQWEHVKETIQSMLRSDQLFQFIFFKMRFSTFFTCLWYLKSSFSFEKSRFVKSF